MAEAKPKSSDGRAIRGGKRPAQTARFAEKQAQIIAAATRLLAVRGLKGFTLADVAEQTGLITQGVSYYFPKKDDLAAACILESVERLTGLAAAAVTAPSAEGRIRSFYTGYMALWGRIMSGAEPPIAPLDEVRALNEANHARVVEALVAMFRTLRNMLRGPEADWMDRRTRSARTALMMQIALSVPAWEYSSTPEDFVRSCERLVDIVLHGLAPGPAPEWSPPRLPAPVAPGESPPREAFLRAATRLINEQGYRGASVEKIAQLLNVSKGAFYHHNEAKDDVVIGCFERTISLITNCQLTASALPASGWDKLIAAARALAEFQLSDDGPLLRTTAVYALPADAGPLVARRWDRVVRRFTEMVSDAIAEGQVRAVDPIVAGNLIMVAINSSVELSAWIPDVSADEIAALYVRPLFFGVLAR